MHSATKLQHTVQESLSVEQQADWTRVVNGENIFLSLPYLNALEETLPNITLLYAISYNTIKQPVFVAVFQIVEFVYRRNFKFAAYLKSFPKYLGGKGEFSITLLVGGNVFATGQNGFIHTDAISEIEAIKTISYYSETLQKHTTYKNKFSAILLKEFWEDETYNHDFLETQNYQSFQIDVNMILSINPSWLKFEDYLKVLKAKFRTRANSVYKKSRDLNLKSLTAEDILNHSTAINQLYTNVLQNSDYTYGVLTSETFSKLKYNLGDKFSFRAVFKDELLIGFSTAFFNGSVMEANYVGLDYNYNVDFAVYQRILYDYLEQAIDCKCTELQLGRTSELIKSALGAKPKTMLLYGKHNNSIANSIGSKILRILSPSHFDLRSPFKQGF